MSIVLHFETSYDAVYTVNGVFLESANKIRYPANQAMYVTVFPLNAQLLPYTIKMIGNKVVSNKELCDSYQLMQDNYFVRLNPRHNYVYSPQSRQVQPPVGLVEDFYHRIKQGDLSGARMLMTDDLNKHIEDEGMVAFFKEFVDIVYNKFVDDLPDNGYFLVTKDGQSAFYVFDILDDLIDNIRQHQV
ncbi:MAG: hypothetical protein LBK70_02250 [Clostridiales bacterium]|jgi:hypothetical protein|nr:hypothetical protein [Clostridiales bacterium]